MFDFDPSIHQISEQILRMVPAEIARKECVLPIAFDNNVLTLAVEDFDEYDFEKFDKLRFVCNRDVQLVSAPRVSLRYAIWRYYG